MVCRQETAILVERDKTKHIFSITNLKKRLSKKRSSKIFQKENWISLGHSCTQLSATQRRPDISLLLNIIRKYTGQTIYREMGLVWFIVWEARGLRLGGLICWALMKVTDGRSQQPCVGKSSHRAEQEVRERLRRPHSTLLKIQLYDARKTSLFHSCETTYKL